MTTDTVTMFLAMLALVAAGLSVVVVVSVLTGDRVGLLRHIRPVATEFAAAVAVTATLGSLYLSEIADFDPCRLCWVQRGFMYPAAVLLAVAAFKKNSVLIKLAGLLAIVGLPVSIFQRYEQAYGSVGDMCEVANPCSFVWVEHFGFMTVPTMAGIGFLTIITLTGLTLNKNGVEK